MSAAHFLFASLQVVPGCGASRRQAALCGALPDRGQEEVYRVRRVLCVNLQQRQILPRLPEAYHPQTSRRAHEEKTRPCYAVGAENPLICKAFRAGKSDRRYFIPFPPKMAFYCVTFTTTAPTKRQGAEVIY